MVQTDEANFERLFAPFRIRDVEIPNRIAVVAFGSSLGGAALWGSRAAGGLGLIVAGMQSVHPTSTSNPGMTENINDDVIDTLRATAEAVHEHGTKIIAQLCHVGHLASGLYKTLPLWGPSVVRAPSGARFPGGGGVLPHAMTVAEIAEVTEAFAAAAARNITAGFDGVEINAAEGYLLAQFISPAINRRDDDYGGSAAARRRFLIEVIAAVRERIGPGPLLGVRVGTDDNLEEGITIDDVREVAAAIGETGQVDYLTTMPGIVPPMGYEPGAFSDLSAAAKQASGLPVLYMGWVDGPETGESLLASDVCDLVGMSRATLADPELPIKARAGELERILPCIACNACAGGGMGCILRPMVRAAPGAENGGDPQKVLVIGAGPAGVYAATQLADRGHSVTIWERDDHLGGQIAIAAAAPHRERLSDLIAYQERELARAGVTVELNHNATIDEVKSFGADAVIVATGALAHVPQIPGIDQANVTDVHKVLRGEAELGDNVLVIMGRSEHRYEALTTAEYIAEQGKHVRVATDANYAGDLWEPMTRMAAYRRLARLGVEFTSMVELVAIRENRVEMRNRYSHEPEIFEVDTIVVAHGEDANSALLAELQQLDTTVHSAGDVVAPRTLSDAFQDAAYVTAQF